MFLKKTAATKKKLLQYHLAAWHRQTTWVVLRNFLQRMKGRERGFLSSPISLSYLHLTTLGVVPIPWNLQPFLEAAECHGRLQSHLLLLLGGRPDCSVSCAPFRAHPDTHFLHTGHSAVSQGVLRSAEHIFCQKTGRHKALFQLFMSQKLWMVCMWQDRINRHQHDSSDTQYMLDSNVQHLPSLQNMLQRKGGPQIALFEVQTSCLHSWRGQNNLQH